MKVISEELKLISPIPVSVNHYLKPRPFIAHGKPMVTMYETAEAKKYKKEFSKYVTEEVNNQNWDIEKTRNKHYYMDCTFFFPRTDMDEQNYFKIMCDAMNDIAFIDDHYILTRTHRIYYDSDNPHINIIIHPVDYIGIFDNQEQLQAFINNNCIGCTNYKNNSCSRLTKALEGRILADEYNSTECLKKRVKKK